VPVAFRRFFKDVVAARGAFDAADEPWIRELFFAGVANVEGHCLSAANA